MVVLLGSTMRRPMSFWTSTSVAEAAATMMRVSGPAALTAATPANIAKVAAVVANSTFLIEALPFED
jgi:hypothetical protein